MTKYVSIHCHCGKGLEISVQDQSSVYPERCPSCGCEYVVKEEKDPLRIRIGQLPDCEALTDHDIKDLQDTYYHDLQVQGEMALIRGNPEQAAVLFQKAANLRPNEAEARIRLCNARVRFEPDINAIFKELDQAEMLLSTNVSTKPMNKFDGKDEIHFIRGAGYFILNDIQRTTEHLQNALNINPDHIEARKLLDMVKQKGEKTTGKSGGCFIATAVYGSYNSLEVKLLRRFRDDVLTKLFFGEEFIQLYYQISPHFVSLVKKKYFLKKLLEIVVFSPLLWGCRRYLGKDSG